MPQSNFKTLKLSDVSSNMGEFIELTAKEKYGKQIDFIDYIPLLDTSRNSDLLREKLRPELEYANQTLLDMINLKPYLQQEFNKNNVPKYYKYFEHWFSKLTPVQVEYFIAYSKQQKTPYI